MGKISGLEYFINIFAHSINNWNIKLIDINYKRSNYGK